MYKKLETERLFIRPIQLEDSEFILELVNSEGWLKFIGDRNIKNKLDAENYIKKILGIPLFFYSVFELKTTGEKLGIITFLNRENKEYPDIGFALLPQFEKNGFTFEASSKYMETLKESGNYKIITGITIPENSKSIKLLEKLGLTFQENVTEDEKIILIYSKEIM